MNKGFIANIFFKFVLFLVKAVIFIGEIPKQVVLLPIKILTFVLKKITLPIISKKNYTHLRLNFQQRIHIYRKKFNKFFTKLRQPKTDRLPQVKIQKPQYIIKEKIVYQKRTDSLTLKLKFLIIGSIVTMVAVFVYQTYIFAKGLPVPSSIGKINYALSSHLFDRNGKLLYEFFREQNRTPVKLKELPAYVYQATVAIEDKDFYKHNGVSVVSGILRASRETILKKSIQGGSTITQQLVKSALLTPERTIQRKIKEIILALWSERIFTKNQILEMYLNQVPYGGSSYGIEEAAKTYFGKKAKELNLEEAAFLAGLPQAPSLYSPYNNPDLAKKRRNDVLNAMWQQKYIDKKTKDNSQNSQLNLIALRNNIKAPHFVFYTKSNLETYFGVSQVEEGGLRVITSLDLDIQEETEKILREELDKIKNLNVQNGAVLVTKPSTGEILAMVGSADYFNLPSGAFNVTTALRQPGSAIKPIMYSLALQKGFTAASIIDDSPVVFQISGSEAYRPVNYDARFHGKIPLRYALANSYNIPAVKTLNIIGVDNFIRYAQNMGIDTWTDTNRYGLSLTLGGGEVTMIDMAEAFGVFANSGYKVPLSAYLRVEGSAGEIIRELRPIRIREINSGIAYIISDILSDNFARQWAFGSRSQLEIPGYQVAVKTGTTNDKKDNWTIGYTPEFMVVVWVGNNDNSPMHPQLASGVTGAAPIWNRVMSFVLKNYSSESKWFSKPEDLLEKNCFFGRKEYFIKGTENNLSCKESSFGVTPTPTPNP
ncbi:MAG: Penicillin-binding protein, 1A family [Candidatus Roizmanbacteria bacterium GW2011_GWA2_36_23]|uniref:Penicillin-binding protein, 1A family n=1 Tax=Candidatus Roizmanbacteria bacterium GW2011_GWA2_36_23 TaxID=1618480 RepID=A0A0G0EM56_9BACT|nr:MAG: Penicillin-binding protein, 1A family [Candidatus Roizmanbacteria bacterium GW2011_GWA2_36_23]